MIRIKELRKQKKITQQELADILNVDRTAVVKYETGKNGPSSEVLVAMADYFGVSVDYLLGASDEPEQQKKPIEADVPDELLNSPIKLEALTAFSSLSPEDQQFFLDMMRARGKT